MRKFLREMLSISIYLLIVLCLTFLVLNFIGQRTQVSGSSMETTLSNDDHLIVDKITYQFRDPRRYDIIVFPFLYAENTRYIKRIIGLPGETVLIDQSGTIYINGEELDEDFGMEEIEDPGQAYRPIELSDDEYFVLGDNRNNSSDSRDPVVGTIHKDDIIGRAWIRIWPLEKGGVLKHQ